VSVTYVLTECLCREKSVTRVYEFCRTLRVSWVCGADFGIFLVLSERDRGLRQSSSALAMLQRLIPALLMQDFSNLLWR